MASKNELFKGIMQVFGIKKNYLKMRSRIKYKSEWFSCNKICFDCTAIFLEDYPIR